MSVIPYLNVTGTCGVAMTFHTSDTFMADL